MTPRPTGLALELRRPERLGDAGFALPRHGLGHRPLHGRQRRDLPGTLAGRHLRRSVLRPPRSDDPRTPAAGLPPASPNTWAGATTGTASTTTASSLPTLISRSPTTTRHRGGWRPTGSSAPGAEALLHEIGDEARPAFYQLVYYPARRRTDEPHDARRPAQPLVRTPGPRGNQCRARRGAALLRQPAGHHPGYNSLLGGKWNH